MKDVDDQSSKLKTTDGTQPKTTKASVFFCGQNGNQLIQKFG
jgi:hypothetical protein